MNEMNLDHVVINVKDDMDVAQSVFSKLGFTTTPRGYHTLGSINHLMMFGTDYMELIGFPKDGVVNKWGRSHDIKNLYIADGSVMTTGAAANPTLTITALSMRLSENVISQLKKANI